MSGIVLSLCDKTGNMVLPWIEAGGNIRSATPMGFARAVFQANTARAKVAEVA